VAHPLKKSEQKRQEPKLGEPRLVHSGSASDVSIAQELKGEAVADTLIRARQQLGQDLRSIAQVLCIRYSYLDAIERGQYENLPGPTYAMGFVRTYADYLGLDGNQLVERFKNEVEGLDSQTKLHFPTPTPEGKMPGGAVFLVAALLFAGAYGVWFYLSNQGQSLSDLVAPVPEQLQDLVGGDPAPAESDDPAPTAVAPAQEPVAAAPQQAQPAPTAPVTAPTDTPPAATPPFAPETPPAAASVTAPPTQAGESQSGQSPAPQAAATPQGGVAQSQPAPQADRQAAIESPAAETPATPAPTAQTSGAQAPAADAAAAQTSALPAPAAELPAAAPPADAPDARGEPYAIPAAPDSGAPATAFLQNHQPTVYGDENTDARIVLKANQDAWVQVRDRQGNLLLTRVLRVGDSYMVPNQADLTLLTGNAGGLEIAVDGAQLPALGPVGAVRRNIPLDPEALKSGAGRQP
jgi:cytoskeleton protein RodZ